MPVPFIDYTTISNILNRLSTLEAQVGLTNTSNMQTAAEGLFFVAVGAASEAPPQTQTDLSKIKVVAFETKKFTIKPTEANKSVHALKIQAFQGSSYAYFAVTPRFGGWGTYGVENSGDISCKYNYDPATSTLSIHASRNPNGTAVSKMNDLTGRVSVIGIAIFP